MARRMRDDIDPRDRYDEVGSRGDYYAQSDSGMPDTRPQRRPGEGRPRRRNDRDRGRRDYDDRGYVGGYEPEKKGGIGKVILKFFLVLILMILSFAGGAFGALKAAGDGLLPENIMSMFNLGGEAPDSDDLLSSYDEDIQEAVKDGTVRELLDKAEEEESSESTGTATGNQYSTGTGTFDNSVVADPNNYAGSDITTNPTDPYAGTGQQGYTDPTQQGQGYVDPNQQQGYTDPSQQQGYGTTTQQQQQGYVDPSQQQQGYADPNQQVTPAQ